MIRAHPASLVADHGQPALVCTWIDTPPPEAATDDVAGVTVKRHSAASCTIVAEAVLTSMVARREDGAVFAATR